MELQTEIATERYLNIAVPPEVDGEAFEEETRAYWWSSEADWADLNSGIEMIGDGIRDALNDGDLSPATRALLEQVQALPDQQISIYVFYRRPEGQ